MAKKKVIRYGVAGLDMKPLRTPPKAKPKPYDETYDWNKPRVSISSERLPDVAGWKVGGEYLLGAKQVGMRTEERDGKKVTVVDLEITAGSGKPKESK